MKSFLIRLFKRIFSLRTLKRFLCVALVLFTLLVLAYTIENFRGAKSWQRARADLEANGTRLDLADHLHPAVPDEENFCAIPLLRDWTQLSDMVLIKRFLIPEYPERTNPVATGESTDLEAWRAMLAEVLGSSVSMPHTSNAAADILEGLKEYDPVFGQLAEGLDRPHAVFAPGQEMSLQETKRRAFPFDPRWETIRTLTRVLQLRADAAAQNGDTEKAIESLRLLARLAEASGPRMPFWGNPQVLAMKSGTWELLTRRLATAAQLRTLEANLSQVRLQDSLLSAMKVELVMATDFFELAKTTSVFELFGIPETAHPKIDLFALYPNGWWDQEKAVYTNRLQEHFLSPVARGDFKKIFSTANEPARESGRVFWRLKPLRFGTLPLFSVFFSKAMAFELASHESLLRQMLTASALERYYLSHGDYPESLDSLAPAFLPSIPLDLVDQNPMRYRKTVDGRYLLYSIGFDLTDDNGKVHPDGRNNSWDSGYDWVWRYSVE
jgi:hypothetical protein